MARRWKILIGVVLAVAVFVGMARRGLNSEPELDVGKVREGLPRRIAAAIEAQATPEPGAESPVFVALRAGGKRLGQAWGKGRSWRHAVVDAVSRIETDLGASRDRVDAAEICLPHTYRDRRPRERRGVRPNSMRGVEGVEIRYKDEVSRHCPSDMIARNQGFGTVETDFRRAHRIAEKQYLSGAKLRSFDAHQFLLTLGQSPAGDQLRPMFRGNTVVPMSAVDSQGVHRLARKMGDWLVNQLQPNGRMVYKYFPSRGKESNGNNMIRQFMASLCLVRLATWRDDPALMAKAERNIRYNFSRFYRLQGEHGLITFRGRSKLGAASLAALGIVEAPFRSAMADYETAIVATTEHMLQPDGRFVTFYGTTSHDNANFYPGETLLLWATLYQSNPDPALLERFMRAFRYYRTWHMDRANRKPSFIPWHVQAYYRMWQRTKDQELADAIFVMSDWLADYQEWDASPHPDMRGRFYDDDRRRFGPPHASSTGVYLEGFIDAYRLAKAVGDEGRMQRYRRAMRRGLRMMMQLQFDDDIDMFYVANRKAVEGGLRTTVYDNPIRVDNVQHGLMAILRILDEFDTHGGW